MELKALPGRLGLGGGQADPRLAWWLLLAVAALYVLGFAAFYPDVLTNDDEGIYMRQTRALLEGEARIERIDPFTGEGVSRPAGSYAFGTALLVAPFMWAAGWDGAFLAPLCYLLLSVLLCGRWLQAEGRSPGWALVILGFPPSLVLGRVVMSDIPSMAVVVLGLLLYWRGLEGGWRCWLASGFLAGFSLSLRNSNPLLFAPFFAGALLRRELRSRRVWALVVGGLLGTSLRFVWAYWTYGDALYERTIYPFSPETIGERLWLYLLGLVVLVPGGLVAGLLYRGRLWPELRSAVALTFLFYLLQSYSTVNSAPSKRFVLALRYFEPLLPLLAFALAEVAPRLWTRALAGAGAARRERAQLVAGTLLALWIGAVGAASLGVHWAFDRWSRSQARIRSLIETHVGEQAVMVTNGSATSKFTEDLSRVFRPVQSANVGPDDVLRLADRHGEIFLVLLDRNDTQTWLEQARENAALIAALEPRLEARMDEQVSSSDRLRIWRIARASRAPADTIPSGASSRPEGD